MVSYEIFASTNQRKHDREARETHRRRGKTQGADPWLAGTFLWPLLLRGTAAEMVRPDRAGAGRPDRDAHAKTGEEIRHGARRPGLRSRNDRRVFQHGGRVRRGRKISREISQAPYSPLPSGILGKILFHAGKCGIPGLRNALWQGGHIYLLRSSLPRGRENSR